MIKPAQLSLKVLYPAITPFSANFRPRSWPPPANFPIVINDEGRVISRYADPVWDMTCWNGGQTLRILFGDGPTSRLVLDHANAGLLRQLVAWWLYAEQGSYHAAAYQRRAEILRPIFKLCSERGIAASDLSRFPMIQAELPSRLPASSAEKALAMLHAIYEAKHKLGFTILDRQGLRHLEASLPLYANRQTPYIPPRIWNYQVTRLCSLLNDHRAHHTRIESLYLFCLDAYIQYFGSAASSYRKARRSHTSPFSIGCSPSRYLGAFATHAEKHGVSELLHRWCASDWPRNGVRALSIYLDGVAAASISYLTNFSLMRIEEACSLRADCLLTEKDEQFGPIYILAGETTKTIRDDDARWITSRSACLAVEVGAAVARMRMTATRQNPGMKVTKSEEKNPYLFLRGYEPWASARYLHNTSTRRAAHSYEANLRGVPQIFDSEQLRITREDLNLARLINPSLDPERFAIGKIWPFANHQLRRTGAVNMQASGLVSDASLQYQLKHVSRASSLYYAQGRSRLRLNDAAQQEFVRTMYEILSKEITQLFTDRYVSPLGEAHKREKLKIVNPKDSKKLMAAAKAGRISYRETLLGGCLKRGPCPFGGIDNIVRCGGGDTGTPCANALYDREKRTRITQLGELIAAKLKDTTSDSPLRGSLLAQQRSVENALDALDR
jgi:hypothetical protein